MISSVIRTGRTAAFSIVVLTVLFLLLMMLVPQQKFTTLDNYVENYSKFNVLPVLASFFIVLANVPLFIALFYYSENEKKIFGLTGLMFGSGYVICSGITYFLQLTVVQRAILEGNYKMSFLVFNGFTWFGGLCP
ncbi:MAG: hypothetical protein HC906_00895 [Bacteroidales bacterium]|nr:hypothetical protein [Bacteroidales bacterium]